MIILLWLLIVVATIVTIFAFFSPEGLNWVSKATSNKFSIETEIKQLREQVNSLILQLQTWQDRERNFLEQLVSKSKSQIAQDKTKELFGNNLQLQQKIKELSVFEEKNKEFRQEVFRLTAIVKRLEDENDKQKNIIDKLHDKGITLQKELEEIRKEKAKIEKIISDQNKINLELEKETRKLKEKNSELADGLSYELNN
ncbi:MAG: hypothetical protein KBB01_04495 [Candidatus Omnitrophica bacterium]|jgi:uncharacterized phage infection (PIP) family protein YhgE|nr:hypothetical protein [Candidatus Omnitrophota bacterium]